MISIYIYLSTNLILCLTHKSAPQLLYTHLSLTKRSTYTPLYNLTNFKFLKHTLSYWMIYIYHTGQPTDLPNEDAVFTHPVNDRSAFCHKTSLTITTTSLLGKEQMWEWDMPHGKWVERQFLGISYSNKKLKNSTYSTHTKSGSNIFSPH